MDEAHARDMLLRGMLAAIREGHDADWCKRNLVKRLGRFLKPPANPNDVLMLGKEVETARKEFASSVATFCSRCDLPHCKGKRAARIARPE